MTAMTETSWNLVYVKDKNAYDLVSDSAIISGEVVCVEDVVTFFYKNKPYQGKVIAISKSYDELNAQLKNLAAKERQGIKRSAEPAADVVVGRRTRNQTTRFSVPVLATSSGKKNKTLTEEESKRKRILELNKAQAVQVANASVMDSLLRQKKDNKAENAADPDYDPANDSDSDILAQVTKNSLMRKEGRVSGISPIVPKPKTSSPSKDALKERIKMLEMKLQFAYDLSDNQPSARPPSTPPPSTSRPSTSRPSTSRPSTPHPFEIDDDKGLFLQEDSMKEGESEKDMFDELEEKQEGSKASHSHGDESKGFSLLDDSPELEYQLRGQGPDMVILHDGVWVNKKTLFDALKRSASVSHFVRRVLVGVFKPSELVNVTLSGQPYRMGDKKPVDPLHPKAIHAIVDYANACAKKCGWSKTKFSKLTHTVSVRLNEIKTQVKAGKLKD